MRKFKEFLNGKTKFIAAILIATGLFAANHTSDQYIYNRVMKLTSDVGSCTAEQIQAPSGVNYVLTAAHCKEIATGGVLIQESGKEFPAIVIAEDPKSDLLLLVGIPGLKGLSIAEWDYNRQEIRTFTHGKGYDTYKTEGVLVQDEVLDILMFEITSDEELETCKASPKYRIAAGFGEIVCLFSAPATVSTAFVAPGSSGGPVVDASGALVGVVSAGGSGYSIFVRLIDIQAFLSTW